MQTLSYPNGLSQKPGRSLAMIALVGSLHLILVYAVLAALDVLPVPTIPTITDATVITKTVHPKPLPQIDPKLIKPTYTEHDPVPPNLFPLNGGDHTITSNPPVSGDMGPQPPANPDTAASALPETHTIPAYPAIDRRLDHEGVVLLNLVIDTNGNVSDASVAKSSGYEGLDAAAVAWVKEHWRYKPATRGGDAVAATARAEVTFRLTQN